MTSLIPNHTPTHRRVRLNSDFTVADIFSIRRTTRDDDPDYQTTYQDPNEGRYALTCDKGSSNIRVFDIAENKPFTLEEAQSILKVVPPTIIEWLLDVSTMRHSNFVPAGFGWDGKFTRAEWSKRQRAHMVFVPKYRADSDVDQEWLQDILDEICRTPKSFLNLNWNNATALPSNRTLGLGDGFNRKYYIFVDEAGNHRLQKLRRVIGEASKHPGIRVPDNIAGVIVLTKGVTCDEEGEPAGCGVELLVERLNIVTTWEV